MSKLINMTDINGVKLNTSGKYCDDDIQVQIDSSLEYKGEIESGAEVDDTVDRLLDGTLTELKSNTTVIRIYTFYQCYSLINIDLPNVLEIGRDAFNDCRYLTNVKLPNVTSIEQDAFYQCWGLTSIDLPNVTNLYCVFRSCKNLKSVNVPKVEKLGYGTFSSCGALTNLSKLPNVQSIDREVFKYCSLLTDIYLGYNGIVSLAGTDSFYGTSGVNVHVRSEYADQYTSATNWSALIESGKIVIVGDYSDN